VVKVAEVSYRTKQEISISVFSTRILTHRLQ
jgi:hypothetical protein